MQRLMPLPNPSAAASSSDEARYTSLKDIIIASPAPPCPRDMVSRAASMHDFYGFDAASIPIRNHLLKHAASAYLQSAAIIASRNQSLFSRIWRQVRRRAAEVGSGWGRCARGAVEAWKGIVRRVLGCVSGAGERRAFR